VTRIKRKNNIVCADYPEGTVVFDLDSRQPHILNALAAEVWGWLCRPRENQELIHLIVRKYAVEKKQARKDVLSLLGQLKEKGLVKDVKA